MFTGIIEEVGQVVTARDLGGGRRLSVKAKMAPELRPDQSVAINGVCQTVVHTVSGMFEVVAVEETLKKTTIGSLVSGDPVNLERALQPTGRLDGHLVQGHVDTTGTVASVEVLQNSRLYSIRFDARYAPYLIPVGSIAIDGVSLTVARLEENTLTVSIIPHTYENTAAPTWEPGKKVNLEFDLIGKYVMRSLALGWPQTEKAAQPPITEAWLRDQGY